MISRTRKSPSPYSSLSRVKVRYSPPMVRYSPPPFSRATYRLLETPEVFVAVSALRRGARLRGTRARSLGSTVHARRAGLRRGVFERALLLDTGQLEVVDEELERL